MARQKQPEFAVPKDGDDVVELANTDDDVIGDEIKQKIDNRFMHVDTQTPYALVKFIMIVFAWRKWLRFRCFEGGLEVPFTLTRSLQASNRFAPALSASQREAYRARLFPSQHCPRLPRGYTRQHDLPPLPQVNQRDQSPTVQKDSDVQHHSADPDKYFGWLGCVGGTNTVPRQSNG